jgi:phosphoribosylcarboxyaminoimidazole (NCAIR) mutase
MHNTLNITQQVTDPLNKAGIAIRHNVMSAQRQADLAAARANRANTIDVAHKVIAAEMARIFPWF